MRQRKADFDEAGASVVVISFDVEDIVRVVRDELESPFLWLLDPARRAYEAYGLARKSAWTWFHPRVTLAYFRAMLGGHMPKRKGADVFQNGGDFVVGADGNLRLAHPQSDVADRPTMDELLAAVRGS